MARQRAQRRDLDLATKLQVIHDLETSGMKQFQIAKKYGISCGQVTTIKQHKEALRLRARSATSFTRKRQRGDTSLGNLPQVTKGNSPPWLPTVANGELQVKLGEALQPAGDARNHHNGANGWLDRWKGSKQAVASVLNGSANSCRDDESTGGAGDIGNSAVDVSDAHRPLDDTSALSIDEQMTMVKLLKQFSAKHPQVSSAVTSVEAVVLQNVINSVTRSIIERQLSSTSSC